MSMDDVDWDIQVLMKKNINMEPKKSNKVCVSNNN
jgi:hypothetical protein